MALPTATAPGASHRTRHSEFSRAGATSPALQYFQPNGREAMSHLLSVSDAISAHARLFPRRTATRDSAGTLTFADWDKRATRLANGLLGLGLAKGDRVALLAYNCVEWMELYVAIARAGLVAVPINFRLLAPEIAYIVSHSESRAIVVQADLR